LSEEQAEGIKVCTAVRLPDVWESRGALPIQIIQVPLAGQLDELPGWGLTG
jgi:hypothetical protein